MADQFDLVILGGGPGGYAAALYGASAGLSVALVEADRIGGTCLHRGCVPAKELLQTAEVLRTIGDAGTYGVTVGEATLDLGVGQDRKQAVVDQLTKGTEMLLDNREVTIVRGRGRLASVDPPRIDVDDGSSVVGTDVVIATGSVPRSIPGFDFDAETILSSDHVLSLREVPDRVAVIGGGAIGCEFASFLVDAGAAVTVIEALPQILTGVDKMAAKVVERSFSKRGISVVTAAEVLGHDRGASGVELRYRAKDEDQTLTVDKVVVSVGRRPLSEEIGLESAGVEVDERGFISVDPWLRTGVAGVYALGDVVATPQLAHVAFAEAIVAVRTMLGEAVPPVDYEKVPWGIYCHPEVGFCGLTEDAAIERGLDVVSKVHRFGGNSRALIMDEPMGLVKVVAERDGPIVGVHIVGPYATELIAEGYLSVNWEATADDLGALVHAHPTLSEAFGETALALTGRSLH